MIHIMMIKSIIMEKQIILNRIQCKNCKDIITSRHVHDFVTCKCSNVSTDGGLEYQHISFKESCKHDIKNLILYSDDPFEKIRESFEWGSYGKSGKEELHYIKLCNIEDDHINNILKLNVSSFIRDIFEKEIKYRLFNKIIIK
jgi:hypothetical protein